MASDASKRSILSSRVRRSRLERTTKEFDRWDTEGVEPSTQEDGGGAVDALVVGDVATSAI